MQLNKIPATVVTVFLSSGKTILLANILRQKLCGNPWQAYAPSYPSLGERLDGYFDRLWRKDQPRQTQLVIIGKTLNSDELHKAFASDERSLSA